MYNITQRMGWSIYEKDKSRASIPILTRLSLLTDNVAHKNVTSPQ